MPFNAGSVFPEWQCNPFVGGLAGKTLYRFTLNGNTVTAHEALFARQHEIRDIKQGSDGCLYRISRIAGSIVRVHR